MSAEAIIWVMLSDAVLAAAAGLQQGAQSMVAHKHHLNKPLPPNSLEQPNVIPATTNCHNDC